MTIPAKAVLDRGLLVNRTSLRICVTVIILGGLSGCAALQQGQVFQPGFWTFGGAQGSNTEAETGLGELAKGDNILAQGHFEKALRANPDDLQALYGLAVLYQNNGQPNRARQFYKHILSIKPSPRGEILIWADKQTQPIVDIAQVNLQLLDSGGLVSSAQAPISGRPGAGRPHAQIQALPAPVYPQAKPQRVAQSAAIFKDADLNIVARFKAMRALLDQGLITQEEFRNRRKVNIGALLPMTAAPAATGLDRPVPAVAQISGRLRAIGRALEMRALSPAQHTAERTMILDALMPVNPISRVNPVPPPKGLMEAADAVRRLEMLKYVDIITSDEYVKERAAIEKSMQPPASASMAGGANKSAKKSAQSFLSGFQPAVHLASYRQKKAARRGWRVLQKQFGRVLRGLKFKIERVDLGGRKGVFYRLKAGPLPSNAAAKKICRKLKAKHQYCDPSTVNLG